MADNVRNEILALSRSRTSNKEAVVSASARFNQVKASFDASASSGAPLSPDKTKRQPFSSSSPTR